ncbi:MAG: hypothetical protein OEV94_08860 [Deltaproteobacteria bacterium]|nr:hypothetical protein [Deltaproteobacteria bacterium]
MKIFRKWGLALMIGMMCVLASPSMGEDDSSGSGLGVGFYALPAGWFPSSEVELSYSHVAVRYAMVKFYHGGGYTNPAGCSYMEVQTVGTLLYYGSGNKKDSLYLGVMKADTTYEDLPTYCPTKTPVLDQYAYAIGYRVFVEDSDLVIDLGFRPGIFAAGLAF